MRAPRHRPGVRRRVLPVLLAVGLAAGCSPAADGTGAAAPAALALPGAGERVLFFGDSYTAGYGATSDDEAFPARTAAAFDWVADVTAGPGTGFVAEGGVGRDYLEQLADLDVEPPALVVLQGGLNDAFADPDAGTERDAASEVLAALADRFPGTPVVLFGPPLVPSLPDDSVRRVDRALDRAAAGAGAWYVSPVQDGWDVASRLTDDDLHPGDEGHAHLARELVAALRALDGRSPR